MAYVMLSNLLVVLFFVYPIVKLFKKIFMHHLAIKSIVIYCITIMLNMLNKVANCIKLGIVKS